MAKKVFIDTNPLIYLVAQQEPFFSKVVFFTNDKQLKQVSEVQVVYLGDL